MQFPWLPEVVKGQVTPSEFPLRVRIWKLRNIRHSGDFFTGSEVPVTLSVTISFIKLFSIPTVRTWETTYSTYPKTP
jgi:hypothetical protein